MIGTDSKEAVELLARLRQRLETELSNLRSKLGTTPDRPVAILKPYSLIENIPPEDREAVRTGYLSFVSETLGRYGGGLTEFFPESPPPAEMSLPLTVDGALEIIERELDAMAEDMAADICACARALVKEKLLRPVLARQDLAERWPWPDPSITGSRAQRLAAWVTFRVLRKTDALPLKYGPKPDLIAGNGSVLSDQGRRLFKALHEVANEVGRWPTEVAYLDASKWAQKALNAVLPRAGDFGLDAAASDQLPLGLGWVTKEGREVYLPPYGLALLYLLERKVEEDSKRPAIALDAGKAHHDLVEGWKSVPKDTRRPHTFDRTNLRVELLDPARGVQLFLPMGDSAGEMVVSGLKAWRSWRGLRNWAALQRLLSVEGSREGWVRWSLDEHLAAMGYSAKNRSREQTRDEVAREVEFFTRLELAVIDAEGKERERRALILVGSKFDQKVGSKWRLNGMELQINPLLYRGVRAENGTIGRNWHPAPLELAQVDPSQNPYTLALGLILPIRWRLAQNEERDFVALSGANVLHLAGINFSPRAQHKAWNALERDLTELRRIGGIGSWRWWQGTPNTLAGVLRLYPADWAADRTLRGVRPVELTPGVSVLNGEELRKWRKERGWTQTQAAQVLGVTQWKLSRAEAATTLSADIAERVKRLLKSQEQQRQ